MYHFTIGLCIAVILSMFINAAYAAETRPYMYRVQQTAQLQSLLNRGSVPVTYETVATTSAGQQVTRYTTRNTVLNATRLGTIARSAVGGPAVLAATAAFVAYDYFYDEDSDTWTTQPVVPDSDYENFPYTPSPLGSQMCDQLSIGGYAYSYNNTWVYTYYKALTINQPPPIPNPQAVAYCNSEPLTGGLPRTIFRSQTSVNSWPITIPGNPVTEDQFGDAVKNAPPQAVSDILNDPISTGTWPDRWPEMVPTVQDVEDQLAHDIEGAPIPVNPDQTITDGSTARPMPDASGGSESSELPAFCDWVPDWLCDVMDLPEHPDVPFVEIDAPSGFDSGVGSGQCPADVIISTQFGSVPISWEYPCELATTFRPVVLFFAWIAALYIVVRVK